MTREQSTLWEVLVNQRVKSSRAFVDTLVLVNIETTYSSVITHGLVLKYSSECSTVQFRVLMYFSSECSWTVQNQAVCEHWTKVFMHSWEPVFCYNYLTTIPCDSLYILQQPSTTQESSQCLIHFPISGFYITLYIILCHRPAHLVTMSFLSKGPLVI